MQQNVDQGWWWPSKWREKWWLFHQPWNPPSCQYSGFIRMDGWCGCWAYEIYMGMDQYLLIPFRRMNIHKSQLFWCEQKGYKVLTHCHIWNIYEMILPNNHDFVGFCGYTYAPSMVSSTSGEFCWKTSGESLFFASRERGNRCRKATTKRTLW